MTLDEVLAVARLGAQQGCTEALFTLGGNNLINKHENKSTKSVSVQQLATAAAFA
jgi:2-iminoacetate synthase ThiH